MAKTYRKKRYYRTKGRWSANIKNINLDITTPSNSSFFGYTNLCLNPIQSDSTVSQQYTVKNIEYSYKIQTGDSFTNVIEDLSTYVMYVPQGMSVTETYPFSHPEYVMAYKYLGGPDADNSFYRNPQKIKTRLSRRLQTGDSIIFLIIGNNPNNTTADCNCSGIVRWWTKAN